MLLKDLRPDGYLPCYDADLRWLFSIFNGDLTCHAKWIHHCVRGCCANAAESARKALFAVMRILQRCRPGIPSINRWFAVGPAIDYYVLNLLCHNVLSVLVGFLKHDIRQVAAKDATKSVAEGKYTGHMNVACCAFYM